MISVLIPARDEAATVGGVVARISEALAGEPHETIVLDDGSRDDTAARARAAGARVVSLEGRGYGAALVAGALVARGEWLAFIDADGTYPEAALPAMISRMRAGARHVIGARPAFSRAESWVRGLGKVCFRAVVKVWGGVEVPDLNSGLRVLHRADLLALRPVLPARFSATTTLTLAMLASGVRVDFLPIAYGARAGKSKWRAFSDTWRMGRVVLRGIGWLRRARALPALPVVELSS